VSPPGVESRLASLTLDKEDFSKLSKIASRPELPSTFQPENISQLVTVVPALLNMLNVRRAIIPGANGHCSARALARYYAALVDGGLVPPPHSSLSKPLLGTHPHIPKFPSENTSKKQKGKKSKAAGSASKKKRKWLLPNGKFGLGFRRFSSSGGSTGFCDNKNRFAIAVTLNKMSLGTATRRIVQS
jgi:hypothetical protein